MTHTKMQGMFQMFVYMHFCMRAYKNMYVHVYVCVSMCASYVYMIETFLAHILETYNFRDWSKYFSSDLFLQKACYCTNDGEAEVQKWNVVCSNH